MLYVLYYTMHYSTTHRSPAPVASQLLALLGAQSAAHSKGRAPQSRLHSSVMAPHGGATGRGLRLALHAGHIRVLADDRDRV